MVKLQIGDTVKIDNSLTSYLEPIHNIVTVVNPTIKNLSGFEARARILSTGLELVLYFKQKEIMEVYRSRETLACLVSTVQDFIDKRDIEIKNPEKELNGVDQHPTTIYGQDWDELIEGFESVLNESGINFRETF